MSSKAIVGALVALVLLGGLAFYLSRGGAAPVAPVSPLAEFDPATVIAIEVTPDGGAAQRVERVGEGEWRYAWAPARGQSIAWPALVPPDAMRAIGRLSGLTPIDAPASPGAARARIQLTLRGGSTVELSALQGALGGQTTLAIESPGKRSAYARIETSVIDALIAPGPASWRIPSAAPDVRNASRLTLTDRSGSIALAKLDGKWSMRRPVSARADQSAVETLIGALAGARVERFEERPPADPAATGLATPAMTLAWEVDERAPDATGAIRVQTRHGLLRIGGPADAQGSLRYASADESGAALMVISASTLTSISTAPRNYLAPTVTGVLPQDVFMLTIADASAPAGAPGAGLRAYRRQMGAWVMQMADSSTAQADGAAVERMLEFLAQRPGEAEPAQGEGDLREVARIDLFDLDGDPLDVIVAGYDADGTPGFRVKNLVILFPNVDPPELLSLTPFASLPPLPGAPAPLSAPEGAPVGK